MREYALAIPTHMVNSNKKNGIKKISAGQEYYSRS